MSDNGEQADSAVDLRAFKAMGVSCVAVFHRHNPDMLSIAIIDLHVPNTPLFFFSLSPNAMKALSELNDQTWLSVPGTDIKEWSLYQQTGQLPGWVGKL